MLGDFNVPKFIENDTFQDKTSIILNFMHSFGLGQFNGVVNHLGRSLDLIMSHFACEVTRDISPLAYEDSHHPALIINITNIFVKESRFRFGSNQVTYNFKKANFCDLYRELYETDWAFLDDYSS
uniref:Uncharacterized protein LOC114343632 n=1 Tax=Diabrotica virgifera virgifera TaxID=50390 RepID=A0A6P7GK24_DIAVI